MIGHRVRFRAVVVAAVLMCLLSVGVTAVGSAMEARGQTGVGDCLYWSEQAQTEISCGTTRYGHLADMGRDVRRYGSAGMILALIVGIGVLIAVGIGAMGPEADLFVPDWPPQDDLGRAAPSSDS